MTRGRLVAVMVAASVASACSNGHRSGASGSSAAPATTIATTTTTTVDRPSGPAADLSEELQGGNGVFLPGGNAPTGAATAPPGYAISEYVAAGTATSYRVDGALTSDGRWTFVPDGSAPYRTRVVVRRPTDPNKFDGTVIVEWLNVSGGVDSGPEYDTMHEEITRSGAAWVGVRPSSSV